MTEEKKVWDETAKLLGDYRLTFSSHWSFNYRNDPKRLPFVLSRYKFAAKMATKNASVLELGSGEGIGSTILAEQAKSYLGVDLDKEAIEMARENHVSEKFSFLYDDFMGKTYGAFSAVVSLDVVEHIYPEHEELYVSTLLNNLEELGILVIGTPNITSAPYASKASQLGHVNLYSQQRLQETLKRYFHNVFSFGMNDEVVHTGYAPMSHYLICVACNKRNP